ncbi:MAG: cobalt-precorrin-5B (C(1))-methyltransferase [Rhodospirillaceae bacterium]
MATIHTPALRSGWTTGACATAAATAATRALLTGDFPDPVTIALPEGRKPSFPLAHRELGRGYAEAGVIKDAGDDPDVTHGALVIAGVRRLPPGSGLVFRAGHGVGTVTRPGLPLAPGEPAINPGPRAMIRDNLAALLPCLDLEVTISIPDGAERAEKTLNGRLGIVGGLSILGTTGVVVPYSCSAWVHSIHAAVDVARAAGLTRLAAVTGKASEHGVRTLYPELTDLALIDVGDFMGGLFKYLRRHPVAGLTVAGGFAKLSKLAAGHLNLHSGRSEVDLNHLAELLHAVGGTVGHVNAVRNAGTALEVLEIARAAGLPLANAIAAKAQAVVSRAVNGRVPIEIAVFDRSGGLVGRSKQG